MLPCRDARKPRPSRAIINAVLVHLALLLASIVVLSAAEPVRADAPRGAILLVAIEDADNSTEVLRSRLKPGGPVRPGTLGGPRVAIGGKDTVLDCTGRAGCLAQLASNRWWDAREAVLAAIYGGPGMRYFAARRISLADARVLAEREFSCSCSREEFVERAAAMVTELMPVEATESGPYDEAPEDVAQESIEPTMDFGDPRAEGVEEWRTSAYNARKKSPGKGAALQLLLGWLVPGIGPYYAGQIGIGTLLTLAGATGLGIAIGPEGDGNPKGTLLWLGTWLGGVIYTDFALRKYNRTLREDLARASPGPENAPRDRSPASRGRP